MFCFCICLSDMYGLFSFFLKDKEHPVEYREQRASTRPLFKWGSDICLLNREQTDLSLLPMTGILAFWKQGQQQGYGHIAWEPFTNWLRFLSEGTSWTQIDETKSPRSHTTALKWKKEWKWDFLNAAAVPGPLVHTVQTLPAPLAHPNSLGPLAKRSGCYSESGSVQQSLEILMLPLETQASTLHAQCLHLAGLEGRTWCSHSFHIHRTEEADSHVTSGLSEL